MFGTIKVLDIIDNPDGTCTIHFDVSDEFQKDLIETLGWSEWSEEKFNEWILEALKNYANNITNRDSSEC